MEPTPAAAADATAPHIRDAAGAAGEPEPSAVSAAPSAAPAPDKPVASEPVGSEPAASEPVAAAPADAKPVASEPTPAPVASAAAAASPEQREGAGGGSRPELDEPRGTKRPASPQPAGRKSPAQGPSGSPVRFFVGGLPPEVEDSDLRKTFGKFGELLEAQVIKDRGTGRSRNFGFVMLADASKKDAVLREQHSIKGRGVSVKIHQDQGHDASTSNGGRNDSEVKKVFIGRLETRMTADMLSDAFSQKFGRVADVFLAQGKNYGFVTFETGRSAADALGAGTIEVDGTVVVIKSADPMREGRGRGGRDSSPPRESPPVAGYGGYPYGYPPAGYYGYPQPGGFYGYPPAGYYPPTGYYPPAGYAYPAYGYGYAYPALADGGYGPPPEPPRGRSRSRSRRGRGRSPPRDSYGRRY